MQKQRQPYWHMQLFWIRNQTIGKDERLYKDKKKPQKQNNPHAQLYRKGPNPKE